MVNFRWSIILDLASLCPSSRPCVLWHVLFVLRTHPFLQEQDILGSSSVFPAPVLKSDMSLRNPASVEWGVVFRNPNQGNSCAWCQWGLTVSRKWKAGNTRYPLKSLSGIFFFFYKPDFTLIFLIYKKACCKFVLCSNLSLERKLHCSDSSERSEAKTDPRTQEQSG